MTSSESSRLVYAEVSKLNPSSVVELFALDARNLGQDVLYFHNGTNGLREAVSFQGIVYQPMPIAVRGMEQRATESQPRPTLTISNIGGFMSAMLLSSKDLVGAMFYRRRTFARYLDGQPEANAVEYEPDIYFVERVLHENRVSVELELSTSLDLDGVTMPQRQVISSYCGHRHYRGGGCEFADLIAVADSSNLPMPGAERYWGLWNGNTNYTLGDTVSVFRDGYTVIAELLAPSATGAANGPVLSPVNWATRQRFRGTYSASITDWAVGDTTLLVRGKANAMAYMHTAPAAGQPAPVPPHPAYWRMDQCAKFLVACGMRFDPMKQGKTLRYGGFIGVLSLPEN